MSLIQKCCISQCSIRWVLNIIFWSMACTYFKGHVRNYGYFNEWLIKLEEKSRGALVKSQVQEDLIPECVCVFFLCSGALDGCYLVTKGGGLGEDDVFLRALNCFHCPGKWDGHSSNCCWSYVDAEVVETVCFISRWLWDGFFLQGMTVRTACLLQVSCWVQSSSRLCCVLPVTSSVLHKIMHVGFAWGKTVLHVIKKPSEMNTESHAE